MPRSRASQQYAITDRRLLFVGGYPVTTVRELPFSPLLRVQFSYDALDRGTVRFWDPSVISSEGEMVVSSGSGRQVIGAPYSFEAIEGVAEVVRILESQRERFSQAA